MFVCVQAQLKDSNLSAEETARAKAEQASKLRDMEKKVRILEQDLNQAQEVQYSTSILIHRTSTYIHIQVWYSEYVVVQEVQNAERARRAAESEREELQDEVQSATSKA